MVYGNVSVYNGVIFINERLHMGRTSKTKYSYKKQTVGSKEDIKKILAYAKDRAEELGSKIDFLEEKEITDGYLSSADVFALSISLSRLAEIKDLITFLESMFPQGNNSHKSTNN